MIWLPVANIRPHNLKSFYYFVHIFLMLNENPKLYRGISNYPQRLFVYVNVLSADVFKVKTLKVKIEEDRGKDAFPAAGQKLIYAGE